MSFFIALARHSHPHPGIHIHICVHTFCFWSKTPFVFIIKIHQSMLKGWWIDLPWPVRSLPLNRRLFPRSSGLRSVWKTNTTQMKHPMSNWKEATWKQALLVHSKKTTCAVCRKISLYCNIPYHISKTTKFNRLKYTSYCMYLNRLKMLRCIEKRKSLYRWQG